MQRCTLNPSTTKSTKRVSYGPGVQARSAVRVSQSGPVYVIERNHIGAVIVVPERDLHLDRLEAMLAGMSWRLRPRPALLGQPSAIGRKSAEKKSLAGHRGLVIHLGRSFVEGLGICNAEFAQFMKLGQLAWRHLISSDATWGSRPAP